jgi:general secretion pathway protein C
MLNKFGKVLMHVVMLAIVSAIAAYWVIKILTPQPTAAPPPLAATPPREPNPTMAARLFGLVQAPQVAAVSNITVSGVFAAGRSGSAVLVVDGKPARAYVIGQEISPGLRLVEVQPELVVLEANGGARQELRAPARAAIASLGGAAPPPAFSVEGNVLSAPSGAAPAATRSMTAPSPAFAMPSPGAQGTPPAPQMPGVGMTPAEQPTPAPQGSNEPPRTQ